MGIVFDPGWALYKSTFSQVIYQFQDLFQFTKSLCVRVVSLSAFHLERGSSILNNILQCELSQKHGTTIQEGRGSTRGAL